MQGLLKVRSYRMGRPFQMPVAVALTGSYCLLHTIGIALTLAGSPCAGVSTAHASAARGCQPYGGSHLRWTTRGLIGYVVLATASASSFTLIGP
jgi:hypothetical protein